MSPSPRTDAVLEQLRVLMVKVVSVPEESGSGRPHAGFFADPEDIREETPLAELGLDSILVTALVTEIERHWEITLAPTMMFEIYTVGDLVEQIRERVAARALS